MVRRHRPDLVRGEVVREGDELPLDVRVGAHGHAATAAKARIEAGSVVIARSDVAPDAA